MNASKLKYRSHLQRRVLHTRQQQLDQASPSSKAPLPRKLQSPPFESPPSLKEFSLVRKREERCDREDNYAGDKGGDGATITERAKEIILRRSSPFTTATTPRRRNNRHVCGNVEDHRNYCKSSVGERSASNLQTNIIVGGQMNAPPCDPPARCQQPKQRNYHQPAAYALDDNMSAATSVLTDEAMEDRNYIMKNAVLLDQRFQLNRQQQQNQQQLFHISQQKQQQQQMQQQTQPQPLWDRIYPIMLQRSSSSTSSQQSSSLQRQQQVVFSEKHRQQQIPNEEEVGLSMGDLVHTAAHDELMLEKSHMISSGSGSTDVTPKRHAAEAMVVTPDDDKQLIDAEQPISPPSVEEQNLFPPSPDHSADVAAGMTFAFKKQFKKQILNKNVEERKKTSTTTPPRLIIPSSSSHGGLTPPSLLGSPATTASSSYSNNNKNSPRRRRRQINLEQRLGTLQLSPRHHSNNNSVVSIQPSVESECVRQNAEIVLAMEDAVLTFLGSVTAVAATFMPSSVVVDDDDSSVSDEAEEDFELDEEEDEAEDEEEVDSIEIRGTPSASEMDAIDSNNGFSIPLNIDSGGGGPQEVPLQNTFLDLFSVAEGDENEEFVDPPLIDSVESPLISADSSRNSSDTSSHKNAKVDQVRVAMLRTVVKKDKNLGTFLDRLDRLGSHLLGGGCNVDKDEESDVFYINNGEFNKAPGPNIQMNRKRIEHAIKAGKDTSTSAFLIRGTESFGGESHATVPRGNTAVLRSMFESKKYKQPADPPPAGESGSPALRLGRRDIDNDPSYSDFLLESDDESDNDEGSDGDDDDDKSDYESDCPPDSEPDKACVGGNGREPIRGIDPEEGGASLWRNQLQYRNLPNGSRLGPVKTSTREKYKSSSLHWQSSNGLILDDEMDFKQLSSSRAKARSSDVMSTTNLYSISSSAAVLHKHFVENNCIVSPLYRRKDRRDLQFNFEGEEDDERNPSEEEQIYGPQYRHEQFVEEFKDLVQKDAATLFESVEEVVVGSVSEFCSANDEFFDLDSPRLRNVMPTRHRAGNEATAYRSSFYSGSNIQRNHPSQPETGAEVKQLPRPPTTLGQQYKHPHHIPEPESRKSRLEEMLRGLGGPRKLSGDSVGTTELGSLITSSNSSVIGVPKAIFHRTHPISPLSARSTPSSMQNTLDYSTNQASTSNQETQQNALNILSRGLTPDVSSQIPLNRRDSSSPGIIAVKEPGGRVADRKNTFGFIPGGTETWTLKHEFFDLSPLDPPPRNKSLGFFPPSKTDEDSYQSDGFGRLNNNSLGSLQIGSETWNLKYDFQDSPVSRNASFYPPQMQKSERLRFSEPIAPPTVYRHPNRIPSRPQQITRNNISMNHHNRLVMKSVIENRDGTRVQNLHFIGREDSPSHQQPMPSPSKLSAGTTQFQKFPSVVKVVKSASSPRSLKANHFAINRGDQRLERLPTEQLQNQGKHTALRQTTNNFTHPKRSLDDKLKSMNTTKNEKPTITDSSQVSASVFEAIEVGSFGVQHTLFSKWEKPKDVNYHPVRHHLQHPPGPLGARGRSQVYTCHGRQEDPVVAKLKAHRSNRARFRERIKAITTKASQKLVMPGGSPPRAYRKDSLENPNPVDTYGNIEVSNTTCQRVW